MVDFDIHSQLYSDSIKSNSQESTQMKTAHSLFSSLVALSMLHTSALANDEALSLENVTITAQKQKENLQEVPLSVTVFQESDLEDRNIRSLQELAPYVPNFFLFDLGNMGALSPTIRGLSTNVTLGSPTVGLYVDGVPYTSTIGYDVMMEEVERVEVLRGPQGSLYGKNAEMGVVSVITKQPNNEFRAKAGVTLGSDNLREYTASASGPLVRDRLYLGIAGKHYEKDGFINNTHTGEKYDDREHNYGKIQLRYTPSESLDISLISSRLKYDDKALSMNAYPVLDKRKISSDAGFNKSVVETHALHVKYTPNDYQIESITTYKKDRDYRLSDMDFTSSVGYHTLQDVTQRNLSEELRLSTQKDHYNWLLGLYGDHGKSQGGYEAFSPWPGYAGVFRQSQKSRSLGIFAHAGYQFDSHWKLSGGVRYDRDKKSIDDPSYGVQGDESFSEVSPKIALEYRFSPETSAYISATKGYHSGGFYVYSAPGYSNQYDKETLWSYEAGVKNSLFGNRLMLNASLYYMDIDDMQVLSVVNSYGQGYVSNAAKATSKGAELELAFRASESVTLLAGAGYNRTTFGEFSDFAGDYKGNTNPFAPRYNYSLGAQYRSIEGFYARVDWMGYGKMYLDNANAYEKDAYGLMNAKVGYEADSFDLYLYAKNLFDKNYDSEGYYGRYTYLSKPREVGVQGVYRF